MFRLFRHRQVSVKNINLLKSNGYVRKNLIREANILHKLNHPNILRLFETMKYGSYYCLVAELLPGGNLCTYVRQQRSKRLDEQTHRRLSRQVATALGYLHGKGIVHRDLKLDNIMLDSRKENIKLVDFGLSNIWSLECPLKTLCGSPEYSAPELFVSGTQYGPEVDIWALGVVMYAMAVGRLPFPCVSALMKTPEKRAKFITAINEGLSKNQINCIVGYSAEFAALLKRLMDPQCDERLTVKEALGHAWMTNRNRWSSPLNDSLDAHDIEQIARDVCGLLGITDARLKMELQTKPYGDVAGVYNIMLHKRGQSKNEDTRNYTTRTLRRSSQRRPVKRSIYTSATPSSQFTRSSNSQTSRNYETKLTGGGGDFVSPPRTGPLKVKITKSPYDTSTCQKISLEDSMTFRQRLKDKNFSLHQPVLPSKLKLKSTMCKVMEYVQKGGCKG